MIKILFMIPNLGHGGAEKVLVNLVNRMNKKEFDITVVALYDDNGINKKFLSPNVKYKYCFRKSFPGIGHLLKIFSPKQLYKWLIKDSFDIVVSYLEGQTARIISGCNDSRTKKVCWIHKTMSDMKDATSMFRNQKEAEATYSSFDRIVSVSNDVQKRFMNLFQINNKGVVLYNTNQSELILKLAQQSANNGIFSENEFKICGMGSLIPVKGFDRLIRVHYELRQSGFKIHTYILGEGAEKEKLEKLINEYNLIDSVSLLGYQKNPYKYLKKCDLFVCSSLSEGFSTAVTESLIVGTPVCTVKVSGMQELLGDNSEYGLIVDNNEKALYCGIKQLLTDAALLKNYRIRAYERGKMFNTSGTVHSVENLFQELVKKNEGNIDA